MATTRSVTSVSRMEKSASSVARNLEKDWALPRAKSAFLGHAPVCILGSARASCFMPAGHLHDGVPCLMGV